MERYRAAAVGFHGGSSSSSGSFPRHRSTFSSNLRPAVTGSSTARWGLRGIADAELGVFAAERYFNEGQGAIAAHRCRLPSRRKDSVAVDGSFSSLPTATSEAIWNSQSSLLSFPPGSAAAASARAATSFKEPGRSPPFAGSARAATSFKKPGRSPPFAASASAATSFKESGKSSPFAATPFALYRGRLFACKCPCSGKKSVNVEERLTAGIKNRDPSGLDLKASLAAKTFSFRTGDAGCSGIRERAMPESTKNELGVEEEMTKVKITPGNHLKNPNLLGRPTRFSLERPFTSEFGRHSSILFSGSGGFSFSNLNSYSTNLAGEPPRASLDALRPVKPTAAVPGRQPEQQRRAAVFPISGDPAIPLPSAEDDDAASDTSSDLFEIESFSTQTTYRRGDSLEEPTTPLPLPLPLPPPPPPPREFYAPSEASIEWSVTTAEGFDGDSLPNFSTAASNQVERSRAEAEEARKGRRKPGGLLGCRSARAVLLGTNRN